MRRIRLKVLTATLLTAFFSVWAQTVPGQAVPGGALDPTTIPKYVTPLMIPPVLYDDSGGTTPINVEVALRQFSQQVLPTLGCQAAANPNLACTGDAFPTTTLWGYGNPTDLATFNNPSFTIEVTKDTLTTVKWINQLTDESGNYLQHIIQDADGNPLIDQTLLWAAPNQDCRDGVPRPDCRGASDAPYTGPIPMVTHVHGAHAEPISDGYPEAWWLPAANNIPAGYTTEGTYYDDINGGAPGTGSAVYQYANDQPTSTLWYHDNSVGIIRQNIYAAGGGYWMVRDASDGETGVISGVLPSPAPKVGEDPNGNPTVRAAIREIPIMIQPKSFNLDGSQFYPADRAFFEGLGRGDTFADNTGVNIPFLPQPTSDIAPLWNPEAFFNTMVVNGNTWPQLEVAQERYRFRLLNAADSRFLNMALFVFNGDGSFGQEIPFYQIGSDQGLLPAVVRIETGYATTLPGDGNDVGSGVTKVAGTFPAQALLLGPGERADVIVDFNGLAHGTVVRMINTAPDAPYGGFPDVPADPDTSGQVMMFVVNDALSNPTGDPSTPAPSLVLDANPGGAPKLGTPSVTRDLALLEEESALVCVTIDPVSGVIDLDPYPSLPPLCNVTLGSVPFAPTSAVLGLNGSSGGAGATVQLWDDPIAQNPQIGSTETWELWNWSADAHPIHLHPVKFEVISRQDIGGAVRSAEPWETGWKDTVIAYPGEVTRIKALFDIPGLYIWNSNILSHQDNEMKVPYCVGDCPPTGGDSDGDGVLDEVDNCPNDANPDQANYDGDSEGDVCDLDDDNDGIPDTADPFPMSNTDPTVVIDGCNSGVTNLIIEGASFSDLIGQCAETASNHGQFVSCVTALATDWMSTGLITGRDLARLVNAADGVRCQ